MPEPTWQCSACSTFNAADETACTVCDTARREAEKKPAPAKPSRPKPSPPPARTTPTKRTPSSRSTPAKRTPAPRKTTPKRKPATKRTDPPGRTPPTRTTSGASGRRPSDAESLTDILASLEWECPNCGLDVVGTTLCRVCRTTWKPSFSTTLPSPSRVPRTRSASPGVRTTSSSGRAWGPILDDPVTPTPPKPPPHEATRGEIIAGCGCLIVIAATVITLIVLLIVNWGSVISFFTGSDSDSADPKPTASASGPCPKQLADQLPKGSADGARLVAAYSREGDNEERYAFCRTTKGKYYYFFQKNSGARYDSPSPAKKTKDGYSLSVPPNSFRFRNGEITAYANGKESWKEALVPEASIK
ncbi:hypothetical protein DY218_25725 [Streptomyces triticagri]|uniref:RanBP2-type domain-containing protein n=1 Tax=Streptomyces triticagri TaxID=2293568 RepID=A0A372LZY9_9ACTN|nr:zinc finger protein [Streptomyces triticagri]RFU83833.1 hypothetical protein DY218_25725 [Streptomyces triticagri]